MQGRFKIGDRVRKRANAGFVGVPMTCVIPDVEENRDPMPCMLCDTDGCTEWPTLHGIGKDEGGAAYHVSDCQLEPLVDV